MSSYDKLTIINRSFWPIYPVIGEALLRLAEELTEVHDVSVIMQDHVGIKKSLKKYKRGQGVRFYPVKSWTTSASGIVRRGLDNIYFMIMVAVLLLRVRPDKVYISTDPPVLVPFIVMIYCRCFRKKYIYHIQDIHPEASRIVIPINNLFYKILYWMDTSVVNNANTVITITDEMAKELQERARPARPINVVENPAVSFDKINMRIRKIKGFSFCGNAGRLQRMPLLLEAIESYLVQGGKLKFAFAGSGIYQNKLKSLAEKQKLVQYFGLITANEAAQLNADYQWALLPIEDKVTRYAFPSKSSSYVAAGALILAICGKHTSVGQWVTSNKLGLVVDPNVEALVAAFKKIESSDFNCDEFDVDRVQLKKRLNFDIFVAKVKTYIVE